MAKRIIQPGQQLERDFALWMERKLGYSHTELNKRVSPGSTAYEIDVYATRRNPRSVRTARVGAAVYVGLFVALLIGGTRSSRPSCRRWRSSPLSSQPTP